MLDGGRVPQKEGTIFGENVVTHYKVMDTDMPFWLKTRLGSRNHVLDGGADPPRGIGNFWGLSKALAIFAAPVDAKRDHSIS